MAHRKICFYLLSKLHTQDFIGKSMVETHLDNDEKNHCNWSQFLCLILMLGGT